MKVGDRVALVELEWWSSYDGEQEVYALLRALPLCLPGALGKRFSTRRGGTAEELSWSKRMLLRDALVEYEDVRWRGRDPWLAGGLRRSVIGDPRSARLVLNLSVDSTHVRSPEGRDELLRGFGEVAAAMRAIYAVGLRPGSPKEVTRGHRAWISESFGGTRWSGIPWENVSMEWFGTPFLPLVEGALAGFGRRVGSGFVVQWRHDDDRLAHLPTGLLTTRGNGPPAELPPELYWS